MADEYTEEQYKKLKRKVDWILLPLMWWCYGIQQTDKTGYVFVSFISCYWMILTKSLWQSRYHGMPAYARAVTLSDDTQNLYGVQADTGMHGNQYSLLTVVFCKQKL